MRLLCSCGLLSTMLLFGCGTTPKETRAEVTGKVTIDGASLAEGTISFDSGDGAVPGNGDIRDGQYKLTAKPGKNKVIIRSFIIDPKKVSTDPIRPSDGKVNTIPDIYNDKSTLSAEVGEKKNFDFELKSTKK